MAKLNLDPVNVVVLIGLAAAVYIMFIEPAPKPPAPGPAPVREPLCVGCDNTLVGKSARGYNSGPARDVGRWEASCNAGLLESCLYHTHPHDEEGKARCRQIVSQECSVSAREGVSPSY